MIYEIYTALVGTGTLGLLGWHLWTLRKPVAPPEPDPRVDVLLATTGRLELILTQEWGPVRTKPEPVSGTVQQPDIWQVCDIDGDHWKETGHWVREGSRAWKQAWLDPNKGLRDGDKKDEGVTHGQR